MVVMYERIDRVPGNSIGEQQKRLFASIKAGGCSAVRKLMCGQHIDNMSNTEKLGLLQIMGVQLRTQLPECDIHTKTYTMVIYVSSGVDMTQEIDRLTVTEMGGLVTRTLSLSKLQELAAHL
jgi:hypothetical protein